MLKLPWMVVEVTNLINDRVGVEYLSVIQGNL